MQPLLGVLIAYVAGSIPFAYLAGKAYGVDLRTQGSGNLGATNALRVLGKAPGGLVYLCDTLKGAIPVLLLPPHIASTRPDLWAIGFGVAAIIGHVFPIFLMGQGGGKGVATSGGVFFALAFIPTLIALAAFVAAAGITRHVSVGSIAAAIVLPLGIVVTKGLLHPLSVISIAISLFVIWKHRSNIARLRAGTEPRFGERKRGDAAA